MFMSGIVCLFVVEQKTAYEMRSSDWSSDVCSADLGRPVPVAVRRHAGGRGAPGGLRGDDASPVRHLRDPAAPGGGHLSLGHLGIVKGEELKRGRSDARRVGNWDGSKVRSRGTPYH